MNFHLKGIINNFQNNHSNMTKYVTPHDQSSNIAHFITNELGAVSYFMLCKQHLMKILKGLMQN